MKLKCRRYGTQESSKDLPPAPEKSLLPNLLLLHVNILNAQQSIFKEEEEEEEEEETDKEKMGRMKNKKLSDFLVVMKNDVFLFLLKKE